jgi:hypothetical protein
MRRLVSRSMPRPAALRPSQAMQAAVMLSAFALLCAATSLAVVLARGPGLAAQASPVPPRTPLQAPPAGLLALAGVELLLPHLSRPFPFPRPHAVATALVGAEPAMAEALAGLAEVAARGAPTPWQLAEGFDEVARAAVLAEMGFGPDAGRLLRLAAGGMRLGAGFGAGGSPALAATHAAEQRLAAGDLAGAVAALDALRGPAAAALADWQGAARRRLAADAAAAWLGTLAEARATLEAMP